MYFSSPSLLISIQVSVLRQFSKHWARLTKALYQLCQLVRYLRSTILKHIKSESLGIDFHLLPLTLYYCLVMFLNTYKSLSFRSNVLTRKTDQLTHTINKLLPSYILMMNLHAFYWVNLFYALHCANMDVFKSVSCVHWIHVDFSP